MHATIKSRANPAAKHMAKLLKDSAYRRACGEFAAEGQTLLREALEAGFPVLEIWYDEKAGFPSGLENKLPESARRIACDRRLLDSLSPLETPPGMLFRGNIPEEPPLPERVRNMLVLDAVRDPGNMGTILRTADAFGAGLVALAGSCADVYNPKVMRAAMGALFRAQPRRMAYGELAAFAKKQGLPLYAAVPSPDALDARQADLSRAAVIIGNEANGISAELLSLADGRVRLPMAGRAESLNAAVAAAVFLWEMAGKPGGQA